MPTTNPRAIATMPTDRAMTPLSRQFGADGDVGGTILQVYL